MSAILNEELLKGGSFLVKYHSLTQVTYSFQNNSAMYYSIPPCGTMWLCGSVYFLKMLSGNPAMNEPAPGKLHACEFTWLRRSLLWFLSMHFFYKHEAPPELNIFVNLTCMRLAELCGYVVQLLLKKCYQEIRQ
ncbi:MAG TPA: hypothetical protein VFW07_26540, partial [Parafilimonas sp.]|nr:hypothetical protein [Parafilimonas sp.]